MEERYCCAVFGHSPMRFSWGFDEGHPKAKNFKLAFLKALIIAKRSGASQFAVPSDPGIGLYAAEAVNIFRLNDPDIHLYCVVPYEEVSSKWIPSLRDRFFTLLEKCTYVDFVSHRRTPTCRLDALTHSIDLSDFALIIYDPASFRDDIVDQAVAYAKDIKKPVLFLHPDTLELTLELWKSEPEAQNGL